MSVFSHLKRSRKAAQEKKVKDAEKEKKAAEAVKIPYKHTPTHAAVDALSGAPSGWKHEDRPKIREEHRRRSQMAMSRTASLISTQSYFHGAAAGTQTPSISRISRHNSQNPTWFDRTGDMSYTHESPRKYKHASRGHSYQDSGLGMSIGPSPLGSNVQSEEVSPAVSSGSSSASSSSDNLEMAAKTKSILKNPSSAPESSRMGAQRQSSGYNSFDISPNPSYLNMPNLGAALEGEAAPLGKRSSRIQAVVYEEGDIFDRLHKSTVRKLGEAPILDKLPEPKLVATPVATQAPKEKKKRWTLLGKKSTAVTAN